MIRAAGGRGDHVPLPLPGKRGDHVPLPGNAWLPRGSHWQRVVTTWLSLARRGDPVLSLARRGDHVALPGRRDDHVALPDKVW